jgi:septin family protein
LLFYYNIQNIIKHTKEYLYLAYPQEKIEIKENVPNGNTDIVLTRQTLQINHLKYAQRVRKGTTKKE